LQHYNTDFLLFVNLFRSIADDILESCVNDVVKELDQINSDVVDHIYNAEFTVV